MKKKKCCEKFRLGTCTATNCPFPHVLESQKAHFLKIDQKATNEDLKKSSKELRLKLAVQSQAKKNRKKQFEALPQVIEVGKKTSVINHRVIKRRVYTCTRCGMDFTVLEEEIVWFQSMYFSLPKKCRDCRAECRNIDKSW